MSDELGLPLSEQLSLAALHLTPLARTGSPLSPAATGFVVQHQGELHLVTNWHVAAGRNAATGQHLHESLAVPVEIRIRHVAEQGSAGWSDVVERLYDSDGEPLWREHRIHGSNVDVAVLPLSQFANVQTMSFDFVPHDGIPTLDVGSSLTVIGYPQGNLGSGGKAIWTNVTIASSLNSDYFEGRPSVLVNGTTRAGQSGAPVVSYCGPDGTWVTTDGSWIANGVPKFFLMGIYSGQIDDRSSEIGIVWRVELIHEVLRSGVPARGLALDPSELPD